MLLKVKQSTCREVVGWWLATGFNLVRRRVAGNGEGVMEADDATLVKQIETLLMAAFPPPRYEWWGIGVGEHVGHCIACVREAGAEFHNMRTVIPSMPLAEMYELLSATPPANGASDE